MNTRQLIVELALIVASCIASLCMIVTYICQISKAPRLLFWLFLANFGWFTALTVLYSWLFHGSISAKWDCTILTSVVLFFMTFSVLWPSVICFDLLQNTRDPRWRWDSPQRVEQRYLGIICAISFFAAMIILLNPGKEYCKVDEYTPPSKTAGVILEFVIPMGAFIFNAVVIMIVRRSLGKEMPFSVRTRRRRQMHNYVLVWCFCWGPYLINAIYSFANMEAKKINHWLLIIRNLSLYSTGWLDLIVFGLQNAWLKRSLRMACDRCRMTNIFCMDDVQASYLKNTKDKVVNFDPSIVESTPQYSSKEYVMRKRLSRHERMMLYRERPDLDMSRPLSECDSPDRETKAEEYDTNSASHMHDALIRAEMEAQEFGISFDQQQQGQTDEVMELKKSSASESTAGDLLSPLLMRERDVENGGIDTQ
jgi:hypothetical protein